MSYDTTHWAFTLLSLAVCLCILWTPAQAQQPLPPAPNAESSSPQDAHAPANPASVKREPAAQHAFWDRDNILLFSGVAVFRGLDYASTRNMQARGRQEILLPDDVVNNSAGFASLEAAATMTSVGISYIFHRTGHHKLERWMSIGHIGVAAFGDVRNYCLKTSHPH